MRLPLFLQLQPQLRICCLRILRSLFGYWQLMEPIRQKNWRSKGERNKQHGKTNQAKNKWISFLADGMLSGIMIGIGGVVSLSSDNRYIGALLFSLGLFCIVQFQYGLYTGKVGYIVNREPAFIAETLVTLVGNTLGAAVAALLIRLTRFASDTNVVNLDVTIVERAQTTVDAKLSDHPLSAFILAVFADC